MNITASKSTINEWLKALVKAKALALFEAVRDVSNYRIGQARNICGKLTHSADDSFIESSNRYGRHTTLAGIWMFLEKDHKKEYLITAFGKRKGRGLSRPAQYYGLHVSHGAAHNVNFSPSCIDYFQKHVTDIDNAEILICHNHPRHFVSDLLSQIMRWDPLPSDTDRETMYQFKHRAIVNWLLTGSFKNVRFFLVENRALREIQLPPVERICQALNWLNAISNQPQGSRYD
jgi:hypothetical protein